MPITTNSAFQVSFWVDDYITYKLVYYEPVDFTQKKAVIHLVNEHFICFK